jgi:hypothetical protein
LPHVLSLHSLESLSFGYVPFLHLSPSTSINLKYLKRLYINFPGGSHCKFLDKLVPQLGALEDLHIISTCREDVFDLKSLTVKKLKMFLVNPNLRIFTPSLELLDLWVRGVPLIQRDCEMPMLRKAVIKLNFVHEGDVRNISKMLNTIAHAQELHLNITGTQVIYLFNFFTGHA